MHSTGSIRSRRQRIARPANSAGTSPAEITCFGTRSASWCASLGRKSTGALTGRAPKGYAAPARTASVRNRPSTPSAVAALTGATLGLRLPDRRERMLRSPKVRS